MRVLYLCHRIPYPPNKGDKIRAFQQLRAIGRQHEVDVFTLADDAVDLAHRSTLAKYCRRLTVAAINPKLARLRALPHLLTRMPLTVPYFHSAELASEVRKALQERSYDRIFVYCSAMAQYVESVNDIPVVIDMVDVDSDKWTQYARFTKFPFSAVYRREGRTLREYERKICEQAACVVVTTDREAELVRRNSPRVRVHVAPNGVDTEYFDPAVALPESGDPGVIFTGDMSYFPNEEAVTYFAYKVLPLIQREVENVRFWIVGRNPGPKVRALRHIEGVEVTGFVPDVRTYLAKALVAVAPFSIAAGIQNKILEAMAYGLPVVATSRAVSALSRGVAELVETGDTAEDMAAKVVLLLRDLDLRGRRSVEGRRRVGVEYRWDRALEQLLNILEHPVSAELPKREIQSSLP